jgi:DNA-binding LytR/AlgR family response regulator
MTPRPLRTVIADDEPLSLRRLEIALEQMPDVEVCASCSDGPDALAAIRACRPDLALLDIRMPGMSGLELASALEEDALPVLVFVTAFGRFAAAAFEMAAVDYLLKPVAYDRLRQAVDRARSRLEAEDAATRIEELKRLLEELQGEDLDRLERAGAGELWAPTAAGAVRVDIRAVDWAEAEGDYVRLHVGTRSYLVRQSMKALAGSLVRHGFLRVHRSAIVRRDNILRAEPRPSGGLQLRLASGQTVSVGRRFEPGLRDLIRGG